MPMPWDRPSVFVPERNLKDEWQQDWAKASAEYEARTANPRPGGIDEPEQVAVELFEPLKRKWNPNTHESVIDRNPYVGYQGNGGVNILNRHSGKVDFVPGGEKRETINPFDREDYSSAMKEFQKAKDDQAKAYEELASAEGGEVEGAYKSNAGALNKLKSAEKKMMEIRMRTKQAFQPEETAPEAPRSVIDISPMSQPSSAFNPVAELPQPEAASATVAMPKERISVERFKTEKAARDKGLKSGDVIILEGVGKVRLK